MKKKSIFFPILGCFSGVGGVVSGFVLSCSVKETVSALTKKAAIDSAGGGYDFYSYFFGGSTQTATVDDAALMTAKLVDEKRRRDFEVFILPNLYGDIITDEAAEFQGGVGTAGSANIGKRYAMFEAIHGSAPRMVEEGRAKYADPCSMLRATAMLLNHIGKQNEADRLTKALDFCMLQDKKLVITGRDTGATCEEYAEYVAEQL